jgi:putative ABC transport system permease protein
MSAALFRLPCKSAWARRSTLIWLVFAIALTTISVLGIERLRNNARENFSQAVSGTDLIVGPRSSATQLVLYSVFRLGDATANLGWPVAQLLNQHPAVAWTIPISLGDSYRGFAVVGTDERYLQHYQYGNRQALKLQTGTWFNELFEVVLGSDVAQHQALKLGDTIALSHGGGESLGQVHSDKPFKIVGVLAKTGTPVDRTVHISLRAISAIHLGWESGIPGASAAIPAQFVSKFDLTPKTITALYVGLKSKTSVFEAQRYIGAIKEEPLMAVLPGVALDQLWQIVGVAENAMFAMAALIGLVSLFGLMAVMLTSLAQRRRELAVLRAVGATPLHLLLLLLFEGFLVTLVGCCIGLVVLSLIGLFISPWLITQYGFGLNSLSVEGVFTVLTANEWQWLAALVAAGSITSLVPAIAAYRQSLSDGLLVQNV